MKKVLDMTGKFYGAGAARDVAEQLNIAEEDGWRYEAEINGEYGRVKAFDAEGNFVGYF